MYAAFAVYLVLGVAAWLTLDARSPMVVAGFIVERPLRLMVWIVLAGLALRTWIATLREKQESQSESRNDHPSDAGVSER
jgi:hypothetical protein